MQIELGLCRLKCDLFRRQEAGGHTTRTLSGIASLRLSVDGMSPSVEIPAWGWGRRLLALLNAPQCKPGKRQTHSHSNDDAWQTLMRTTMSATEKAKLFVLRSTA
jgi:hypothetical protein